MNLASIRSMIRMNLVRTLQNASHLGNASSFTDTELDLWINQTYKEFCGDTELLSKSVTLTLSGGVAVMPDDLVDVKIVSYAGAPIGSVNRYALEVHPEA